MQAEAAVVKKPHLSFTQLDMLSKCGEQYRRRYVLGERLPPGVAMIVGGAVDKSVNANMGSKKDTGALLPIEQIKDTARDALNSAWEGGVILQEDERRLGPKAVKGEAVDKSVRLSVLHASETAPVLNPTHIQRKWELELPGYDMNLLGYIDLQEGSESVRDTKTSGKTPAGDIADQSDQLTAYALAAKVIDGKAPKKVCLDYLIDNKTPKAVTFESTRTDPDFASLLHRVEVAIVALEKGVFIPARQTDWWCSPKWCGYFSTCRYVRKPKQFAA